jgi:hypothetical protein
MDGNEKEMTEEGSNSNASRIILFRWLKIFLFEFMKSPIIKGGNKFIR